MITPPVDVTAKGAVCLGKFVTCDGFVYGVPSRVQTHIHSDHMGDFSTSKQYQNIYMSEATKDLLIAEGQVDLPHRSNIHTIKLNHPVDLDEVQLELIPSGHMLGAVQVQVTTPNGLRLGYSSDFRWPVEKVIQVDALVVDSTYGSPGRVRYYTQEEVNERFIELVMAKLRERPVIIYGFRGTLERALMLLEELECPVVASNRAIRQIEVHRRYGYARGDFITADSEAGQQVLRERRFIRLVRKGEDIPESESTVITLSAQMSDPRDPVIEHSEKSYFIAMTGHADFEGTLGYIAATGARYVVTDNSRGGHAVELAQEIRARLNIDAIPSSSEFSHEWGKGIG